MGKFFKIVVLSALVLSTSGLTNIFGDSEANAAPKSKKVIKVGTYVRGLGTMG